MLLTLALQRRIAAVGSDCQVEEMQVCLVLDGPVVHLLVGLKVLRLADLAAPAGHNSPKVCCGLPMRVLWLMRLVESKLMVSPPGHLAGHRQGEVV